LISSGCSHQRSLHIVEGDALALRARVPPVAHSPGGIES